MDKKNKSPFKFYVDQDVHEFLRRIESGARSEFLNKLVRQAIEIKLSFQQRTLLNEALSRVIIECESVSSKYARIKDDEYSEHFKKLKLKYMELQRRVVEGELLTRQSSELNNLDHALFAAECQCHSTSPPLLEKAKAFFELRKHLEQSSFEIPN